MFSGEEPKPRAEASYEEWVYDVTCSRKDKYPEHVMSHAIRKSLRGQAKRVLLPMGVNVTVDEMLCKLKAVFGNVAAGESVLQEFYTTAQKQGESVAAWGLRLEEIVQRAIDKGHVRKEDRNEMLRSKFWRSLRNEKLKMATRIHYENVKPFEELQRAVRAEECDMKLTAGVQHQPMRTNQQEESKLDRMMAKITALEKQMEEMNRRQKKRTPGETDRNRDKKNRQRRKIRA